MEPLRPLTDDETRLAEELVQEALMPYEDVLLPEERALIRDIMMDELTLTEDGRRKLRAASADPVVKKSGDVVRAPNQATIPNVSGKRK